MDYNQVLTIGFDDTDSPKGMCTTFLAYRIVEEIKKTNCEFIDFPKLIRFNPNIPWKTRGNGAVSLSIKTNNSSRIKNKIKNLVKKYSDIKNGANPGLVFYEKDDISKKLTEFSNLALWQLISRNYAKKFAIQQNLDFFYLGNGQGLVGAIGAIGYQFNDHTLELLSYRKKSQFGKKREISIQSVKEMQKKTAPFTFNNFDTQKNRVLITPRGPDPVFYGIRGEKIDSLLHAAKILKHKEQLDGYMIFKSNQGTGDHLKNELDVNNTKPYYSGKITGVVSSIPKTIRGGHVFFHILSKSAEILCAVYSPTGLGFVARNLALGDKICVGGGIRKASRHNPRALNTEFIKILSLKKILQESNPLCVNCNKKMKSKGVGQNFQCIKCGAMSSTKEITQIPRQIQNQLYIPKISAHRHLTRPEQRLNMNNDDSKFIKSNSWFHTFRNYSGE